MPLDRVLVTSAEDMTAKHQNTHEGYEYFKKTVLSAEGGGGCQINIYEIPPGKAAYPYHWHYQNEEIFYIVSGIGTLRTPDGEQTVSARDFLVFPPCEAGAHKLTNASGAETLVYIDFDTCHPREVCFYPDTNKVNFIGDRKIHKLGPETGYYDGE